jgi:hypothetical protein
MEVARMAMIKFTYDDIPSLAWRVVATLYTRSYSDGVTTLDERGTYDVGVYASHTMAVHIQDTRSQPDALRDAYGTWGMENMIVTFAIIPQPRGAYDNLTSFSD